MAIYSKRLAAVAVPADSLTLLYTVPPAGGPAIVKSVGYKIPAGNVLYVINLIGGVGYPITGYDNSAGALQAIGNLDCWSVAEPGDEIYASTSGAAIIDVILNGYQFSAP